MSAIAPYASQLIGDTFDHTDDPNKAAQLLSHAVLGAIIAYMNGGDPVAGTASATASELASMVLAKELYPEAFDEDGNLVRSRLSEEQAQGIVAITNAIGALAGGITGGDAVNTSLGSFIGENAIKNNFTKIEAETEQRRLAEYGIPSIALLDPSSPGGYIVVPISEIALRAVVIGVENLTEEERAQLAQAQNGLMDISDIVEAGTIAVGIYAGAEIIYVGGKYLVRNGDKLLEITKDQYNKFVRGGGDEVFDDVITFGSNTKSSTKLYNQMTLRGWTEEIIVDTVANPYTTRTSINLATQNSATVYYTKNGAYVIIDDVTKEVVQISDAINPSDWIPDSNIENPFKP